MDPSLVEFASDFPRILMIYGLFALVGGIVGSIVGFEIGLRVGARNCADKNEP